MSDENQRHRAAVLTAFHEGCPRPDAADIRAWIARHPDLAEDIRLHAEASLAEAQGAATLPESTPALIARTRTRALTALAAARMRAGSNRGEKPGTTAGRAGIAFVDIRTSASPRFPATRGARSVGEMAEGDRAVAVPLASMSAACGLPCAADDHMDEPVDFNELLVRNPAATFAVRISGESMRERGLLPGDIAVVDRGHTPVNGCIVLGLVDGEFTVKTFRVKGGAVTLEAANPDFPNISVDATTEFEVWGVVVGVARAL